MSTSAASSPLTPGLRRAGAALGAVFVGSSLIAVMPPAHAEPSPSGTPSPSVSPSASASPPASASTSPPPSASPSPSPPPSDPPTEPPTASAVIDFENGTSEVKLGESAPANPLTVSNTGDASICLTGLDVKALEFSAQGFEPQEVAPGDSVSAGEVTGRPSKPTDVVAILTYALAQEGVDCTALEPTTVHTVATGAWTVSVTGPSHTPPPTPSPTPSPDPTESETSPPPDPDPSGTPEETEDPTKDPSVSGGSGDGNGSGGSGDRNDSGRSGNPSTPSNPSTGGGVGDVPTSDVPTSDPAFPDLPSDDAALPEVAPGSEDLAALPTVTPGSGGDELDGDETEVAAGHGDLGPNMAPAVLLAAFLLALLLATPLAPARRVRVGGGYQGKRRRQ
ncbi:MULTISPECIES: hypothetical protein [Nocardiopsis]|uniref:Uncharacterized protein n=1 Tax=Nocardiopsis sinuspersici TaxID=501010 RepID=A0A1V3C606_9ACTN|nr:MULTISPECIES: hypothetical protein [Nocardiopsis]OOC55810.1 hypothetical protein NOSIN_19880 [Nocardiopsis sinuspersici]